MKREAVGISITAKLFKVRFLLDAYTSNQGVPQKLCFSPRIYSILQPLPRPNWAAICSLKGDWVIEETV